MDERRGGGTVATLAVEAAATNSRTVTGGTDGALLTGGFEARTTSVLAPVIW